MRVIVKKVICVYLFPGNEMRVALIFQIKCSEEVKAVQLFEAICCRMTGTSAVHSATGLSGQ